MIDEILLTDNISALNDFINDISKLYAVRKSFNDDDISFNGSSISQETQGNMHMDIANILCKIKPINAEKNSCKQAGDNKATTMEMYVLINFWYISAIGICRNATGVLYGLFYAKIVKRIRVCEIIDANARLKELSKLP